MLGRFLLIALLWPFSLFGADPWFMLCNTLMERLSPISLQTDFPDVSLELELNFLEPGRKNLLLLTTTDGTIGPVLGEFPAPDFLEAYGPLANAKSIRWDALKGVHQKDLLNYVGNSRYKSPEEARAAFFKDRTIPGLKVVDEFEIAMYRKPNRFLGREYSWSGKKTVSIGQFFGKVEYGDYQSILNFKSVELHVRAGKAEAISPFEVADDINYFLKQQGIHANQHMHIVAKLPQAKLFPGATKAEQRELMAALATKLAYEANLVGEFLPLMEGSILPKTRLDPDDPKVVVFNAMTGGKMGGIAQAFVGLGRGTSPHFPKNDFKMNHVGVRFTELYDGHWGLEVRILEPTHFAYDFRKATIGPILNALQAKMQRLAEGNVSPQEIEQTKRWLAERKEEKRWFGLVRRPTSLPAFAEASWYNQPLARMISAKAMPPHLIGAVNENVKKALIASIEADVPTEAGENPKTERRESKNYQLKMLLFDWRLSPVVHLSEDPKQQQRLLEDIRTAQLNGLAELEAAWLAGNGKVEQTEQVRIAKDFLAKSGLLNASLHSLVSP